MTDLQTTPWDAAGAWGWSGDHWVWALGMHGLFWIALVVLVAALVLGQWRGRGAPEDSSSDAMAILDARYARGEIGRPEYLERKHDIKAGPRRA